MIKNEIDIFFLACDVEINLEYDESVSSDNPVATIGLDHGQKFPVVVVKFKMMPHSKYFMFHQVSKFYTHFFAMTPGTNFADLFLS